MRVSFFLDDGAYIQRSGTSGLQQGFHRRVTLPEHLPWSSTFVVTLEVVAIFPAAVSIKSDVFCSRQTLSKQCPGLWMTLTMEGFRVFPCIWTHSRVLHSGMNSFTSPSVIRSSFNRDGTCVCGAGRRRHTLQGKLLSS